MGLNGTDEIINVVRSNEERNFGTGRGRGRALWAFIFNWHILVLTAAPDN